MRYFQGLNIMDTSAYGSTNARLLYLHLLCVMDYSTRVVTISSRQLGYDLNMTHKAVRCALETLLTARLIRAQEGAQARAHATTYIISDLDYYKGTSEGTSEGTPLLENNKNKYSLTRAREEFFDKRYVACVGTYCSVDYQRAEELTAQWMTSMAIKKKEYWLDKTDAWQHCLDWCNKHKKR